MTRNFGTIVALLALAALLLPPDASAKEPRSSKTRLSQSGQFGVKFTDQGDGTCRLEVLKDDAPFWKLERCVGSADDLFFVSDDGGKVWLLVTLPKKATKKPKKARYPAWTYAVVAALYDREGKQVRQVQLNDLVKTKVALDDVQQLEKHFKWLDGVAGVTGIPPKLNEQGKVELQAVDHKKHVLDF